MWEGRFRGRCGRFGACSSVGDFARFVAGMHLEVASLYVIVRLSVLVLILSGVRERRRSRLATARLPEKLGN